jgi:hypothetical protein
VPEVRHLRDDLGVFLTKTFGHRGLFFILALVDLVLLFPARADAESSLKTYWFKLFKRQPPSAEESALSPISEIQPSAHRLLQDLSSRRPSRRLEAIESIAQTADARPGVIAALIRTAFDGNAQVSGRATETLVSLCQSGHAERVVREFLRTPRIPVAVLRTDHYFKIPDPADEKRIETLYSNHR